MACALWRCWACLVFQIFFSLVFFILFISFHIVSLILHRVTHVLNLSIETGFSARLHKSRQLSALIFSPFLLSTPSRLATHFLCLPLPPMQTSWPQSACSGTISSCSSLSIQYVLFVYIRMQLTDCSLLGVVKTLLMYFFATPTSDFLDAKSLPSYVSPVSLLSLFVILTLVGMISSRCMH